MSIVYVILDSGAHSLALKNDSTVWAWGENEYGQLGNGTFTNNNLPVNVTSLTGVSFVAGGDEHSLAVKNDGTVWAWACNCLKEYIFSCNCAQRLAK